jgi:hypothetical protein
MTAFMLRALACVGAVVLLSTTAALPASAAEPASQDDGLDPAGRALLSRAHEY